MIRFGNATKFEVVLAELNKRLRQSTGFPKELVIEYLGEAEDLRDAGIAERFIAIRPESLPIDQLLVAGGGEINFSGVFQIALLTRLGVDQQLRDAAYLRDASKGLLIEVAKVLSAVQLWKAEVTPGESILLEPSRVVGSISFQTRKPKIGWGYARIPVELKFRLDL